eukprot:9324615-Alexandrium_andersonii.AAC.1
MPLGYALEKLSRGSPGVLKKLLRLSSETLPKHVETLDSSPELAGDLQSCLELSRGSLELSAA